MQIYGVSVWEASRPIPTDWELKERRQGVEPVPAKPLQAAELTPALLAKLGKHITRWKPDQWTTINVPEQKEHVKGRKPVVLHNADMVELFDGLDYSEKSNDVLSIFDDILHGVARLDMGGNTRPLRKKTIYVLLAKAERLSTDIIMEALNVQKRQAQRYMQACGIAQGMIRNEVVRRGMYNKELLEMQDNETITTWEEELTDDEQFD